MKKISENEMRSVNGGGLGTVIAVGGALAYVTWKVWCKPQFCSNFGWFC